MKIKRKNLSSNLLKWIRNDESLSASVPNSTSKFDCGRQKVPVRVIRKRNKTKDCSDPISDSTFTLKTATNHYQHHTPSTRTECTVQCEINPRNLTPRGFIAHFCSNISILLCRCKNFSANRHSIEIDKQTAQNQAVRGYFCINQYKT